MRGKTFATYVINHHGDGRIALWLNAPDGAQELYTKAEPKHFFVPPYVGPRGWLGVHLDKGISWKRVAKLVREAYEKVAPPALSAKLGKTIEIAPPTQTRRGDAVRSDAVEARAERAQDRCAASVSRCRRPPRTKQFGSPVWRAGKKTFAAGVLLSRRRS